MILHSVSIIGINLVAIALIAGMLLGGRTPMPTVLHIDRTVRDVCIALWSFVIPGWFTVESTAFLPDGAAAMADFYKHQHVGQVVATFVGTAVAIVLGLSSLPASEAAEAFRKQARSRDAL